jgi:hypothetical protein
MIEHPFWAVESACWYWKKNGLSKYANQGNFFAVQGLVNRGSAKKQALDYDDRLKLYDKALRAVHNFSSADTVTTDLPSGDKTPDIIPPEIENAKTEEKPFFDRATSWITDKRTKLSQVGVDADPMAISTSSKTVTFLGYLKFAVLAVISYVYENPLYLVLAIALLIAIIWFISHSKDRKNVRASAPLNQQTNINVEAK